MGCLPPVVAPSDGESDIEELPVPPPIEQPEPKQKSGKVPKARARKMVIKRLKPTTKLPPHGLITASGVFRTAKVPLKTTEGLNLKVACNGRKGKKENGAARFTGSKTFRAWSTIRCFSATTSVCKGDVSCRGISDLANQIAFSTRYQNEMKQLGLKPGQYLAPSAGEWFQGLPEGWTSDVEGAVNPRALPEQFGAWDSQEAAKIPCVSLFSGVGGLEAGASPWFRPVCFVECDDHCRRVLSARMAEGALPACPIIEDVVGFQPEGQVLTAKAVTAGFPCQDISQAGNQAGLHGHRSSLIKEAFKTYDCLPNAYMMLLENVSALLGMNKECRKVLNYILQAAKKGTWPSFGLQISLPMLDFQLPDVVCSCSFARMTSPCSRLHRSTISPTCHGMRATPPPCTNGWCVTMRNGTTTNPE